jgi:hypothetical protein
MVDRGLAFLYSSQQASGLIVEKEAPGPNFAWNGLVFLADMAVRGNGPDGRRERLLDGLLSGKGISLEAQPDVRQNSALQGWSWIEGTFSWIEPTAHCLLALKMSRRETAVARLRLAEAEAVLVDRACVRGGWNYGNSQVLGQELRPYVPTTALALLAMQDRLNHPVVARSMEWLTTHALDESSRLALALSTICLRAFSMPYQSVLAALTELAAAPTLIDNVHNLAMTLYAMKGDGRAFTLVNG